MSNLKDNQWDLVIRPYRHLFDIKINEVWKYHDLLFMFIKRDIIAVYKQTILGPLWYFFQPLMTMLVYIVIFANVAKIPTDGIPPPIFYLAGIIIWNYFSDCFNQTSDTFYQNAFIFGKVYFPRLILPLSKVVSGMIKLLIQSLLFLAVYLYFFLRGSELQPNIALLLIPYLVILMAGLGLGGGIIFSSLTTKYRDLKFLISFGVQLLMYATPVIYPLSIIPDNYRVWIIWNPLVHLVEGFKFACLGSGELTLSGILYTTIFTMIILITGVVIFNRAERDFMDTV